MHGWKKSLVKESECGGSIMSTGERKHRRVMSSEIEIKKAAYQGEASHK